MKTTFSEVAMEHNICSSRVLGLFQDSDSVRTSLLSFNPHKHN